MTKIVDALKSESTRVGNGSRWLAWDEIGEQWVVYERKYRARQSTVVVETKDEEIAVDALLGEG